MGSKRFGGRYTPKNSFETVYMAKDIVTALKEVQALISIPSEPAFTIVSAPWVTVAIQGFLSSVLDLTQAANVQAIDSSYLRGKPVSASDPERQRCTRRKEDSCSTDNKARQSKCVGGSPLWQPLRHIAVRIVGVSSLRWPIGP